MSETKMLRYAEGSRSIADLQQETDAALADLKSDAELLARVARELDVPEDELRKLPPGAIRFDQAAAGVGVVEGAIIVALLTQFALPVAREVTLDLWREFLLPRLKSKLGNDAIGDEED